MLDRDNPGHERWNTGVSPVDLMGRMPLPPEHLDFNPLGIARGSRPKVRLYPPVTNVSLPPADCPDHRSSQRSSVALSLPLTQIVAVPSPFC